MSLVYFVSREMCENDMCSMLEHEDSMADWPF